MGVLNTEACFCVDKKISDTNGRFFIDYINHSALAILRNCYIRVCEQQEILEQALLELNLQRGNHIGALDLDEPRVLLEPKLELALEKEFNSELAELNSTLMCKKLFAELQGLSTAIDAVHKIDNAFGANGFTAFESSIAQNNLMCARERLEMATALFYDTELRTLYSHFRGDRTAIEHILDGMKAEPSPRVFVIKANAYDDEYRYNTKDGVTPPDGPYMTMNEACVLALIWIGVCDGMGNAVVQNRDTEEFYSPEGHLITGDF